MRLSLLFLVCLVLLVMVQGSDDSTAATNPVPPTDIWFSVDSVDVTPHPTSITVITLHGNASIRWGCGIDRHIIYLSAQVDDGWPVKVRPSEIPFFYPSMQRFNVVVTVPPGASVGIRNLTVTGTTHIIGLAPQRTHAVCQIDVGPYYRAMVEPVGSHCVRGSEGVAVFPMRLWNTGTWQDLFTFDIVRRQGPIKGWSAPDALIIPPRGFQKFNVTVDYDNSLEGSGVWMVEFIIEPSSHKIDIIKLSGRSASRCSTLLTIIDLDWTMGTVLNQMKAQGIIIFLTEIWLVALFIGLHRWMSIRKVRDRPEREEGPRTIVIGFEEMAEGPRKD